MASRLNVLIVVTSTDRRGAEVEGSQLAEELRLRGHGAECVALAPGGSGGLAVEALGPTARSPRTLRELRRRARGTDLVMAYGSSTLPACVIALLGTRVPFIYRSIGDPAQWVRGGWHRRRTGWLFRRAALVVALWPAAATAISRLYRVPAERLVCVANARPLPAADEPDRAVARSRCGLPDDVLVVVWAGALTEEKQPLLAVSAVAAVPEAWLVMAGDGPLRPDVEAACRAQLAGRYRLTGAVASLVPLWAAADVALLTSRTEGMPGVLIEARLRGVPGVATDVGAVREVVGERGAVVSAEAVPVEVAAAIERVAFGPGPVADPGAARFTWPVVVAEWERLLARWER
ncbi:MAG: glycosyltransferase [Ilumatobacteraceae bacterium]